MPHKWANPMGNISAQRKSKITIGNELYTLTYYELYHGRHDINKWYLNTWTTPLWYEASNLGLWDHHNIPVRQPLALLVAPGSCVKYWMLAVLNSLWRHPLPEQDKNLPGECGCWSWFENGKQGAGRWPDSKWSQEWMKSGQWCSKGVSGEYRIEIEGRFDLLLFLFCAQSAKIPFCSHQFDGYDLNCLHNNLTTLFSSPSKIYE